MLDKGENKDNGIGGYTIQNIITLGNDEKSRNKLNNMLYTPVIDGASVELSSIDDALANH